MNHDNVVSISSSVYHVYTNAPCMFFLLHLHWRFDLFCSFITGSYDRTCKVWDTASGEELHTLEGHKNVVYAIAFNNPYG